MAYVFSVQHFENATIIVLMAYVGLRVNRRVGLGYRQVCVISNILLTKTVIPLRH